MLRTVGDQLHPLGLQTMSPEGADHVGQPLRAVAQGEAAPVFYKPGCGGAQLLQGAAFLAPGASAALPAAHREVGRVGDHQVEAPRGRGAVRRSPVMISPGRPLAARFSRAVWADRASISTPVRSSRSARPASSRRSTPLPVPRSHTRQPGLTVENSPAPGRRPPRERPRCPRTGCKPPTVRSFSYRIPLKEIVEKRIP